MTALAQLSRCLAPCSSRQVEIAERKGIGHPDTNCDALAEKPSPLVSTWDYLKLISSRCKLPWMTSSTIN